MRRRLALIAVSASIPLAAASLYACGSDSAALVDEGPADVTTRDTFFLPRDDASTGSDSNSEADGGRDGSRDGQTDGGRGEGGGEAGPPLVKINEVFVDKNLAGDATEWVELWAPVGTSLSGLRLRLIYPGDAGVKYEVDVAQDGGTFTTNYWVVGGILANGGNPDQTYTIAVWGLADVGAIQLVKFDNGQRTLLDVVGYGDNGAAAVPPLGQQPNATVEGQIFIYDNNNNRSFSRKLDDAGQPLDTDNNANDFCNTNRSFRGASNACQ